MIDFFIENWNLVPFGAAILCFILWELLWRKPTANADPMTHFLAVLFATYGIAWVTQELRVNQEKHTAYLIELTGEKLSAAADNEYAKGLLEELEQRLKKFELQSSEAAMESDVRSHLIRALRSTRSSAWFLDHYVLVWAEPANPELDENANAIVRGVEIRRVFVLSDALTRNRDDLAAAIRVMDDQRRIGVKVLFVLQTQLQRYPEYQRHADVNYGIYDNRLLAKISARASPRASPTYCLLSWGSSVSSQDSPQTWIEGTATVREYSDNAKTALLHLPATLAGTNIRQKR
jgi:hypothetical protein